MLDHGRSTSDKTVNVLVRPHVNRLENRAFFVIEFGRPLQEVSKKLRSHFPPNLCSPEGVLYQTGGAERVNDFAPLVVTSLLSRSVSVGS